MSRGRRPYEDPPPLDPYGENPHAEDSELGLPENYYDSTQYRALVPDPPETMGFGGGI